MYGVLAGVLLLCVCALGAVQAASDGIFASAAQPGSIPARISPTNGAHIYALIARVAPAPYVYDMLARAALAAGDLDGAQTDAMHLPPSVKRADLLGLIAQQRGDDALAQRDFVAAADLSRVDAMVKALIQKKQLDRAYALELAFQQRLLPMRTHPDALAQTYFRMGSIASWQGHHEPAMHLFAQAVRLSPLNEKYLLSAGYAAMQLHERARAQGYFQHILAIDPASADGITALRRLHRELP